MRLSSNKPEIGQNILNRNNWPKYRQMNCVEGYSGPFTFCVIYPKHFTDHKYINQGTGRNWFYTKTSSDEDLITELIHKGGDGVEATVLINFFFFQNKALQDFAS